MVLQGNNKSSFENVVIGVPHGSVWGPFLFVIADNDVAFNAPCNSILFADDTTLINSSNLDNLLQKDEQSLKYVKSKK